MSDISVVTAVRNGAAFIAESLRSALRQSAPPIEIVVVDGGSDDGTDAVVATIGDDRVRLLCQGGMGASAARNEGVAAARGDLIAFLDADDVWHPEKLHRQLERIRQSPHVGLVGCGYVILDESLAELTRIGASEQSLERWLWLEGNGFALTSTGLLPKAVFDSVGGFDVELPYSGDLDLALRIAEHHDVVAVDEVLVGYRSHPGQLHRDAFAYERDMRRIIERRITDPRIRRRALANLYIRVGYYHLANGYWRSALVGAPRVLLRGDRLVGLPLQAVARRRRRATTQSSVDWPALGR